MTWDLHDYRLVTASAYPGMMAPLIDHPACAAVLSGDGGRSPRRALAVSLEGLDGIRRRWRFGDVARLADFVPKVLSDDSRPVLVIPPRVSPAWEAAAAGWPAGVRLAGLPSAEVGPIAEDKVLVRRLLNSLGIPVPAALTAPPSELDFRTLSSTLDFPFVLQAPDGAGGQGTFLVRSPADLAAALAQRPHAREWLASRYCGDLTVNITGVVFHDGVHILPASVQSSGIHQLAAGFGAYCGSEFGSAAMPAPAVKHAATIGDWLRQRGYLGLFGVDIAVDGDHLAFLELNPRIQGSSWLLSKLQRQAGQVSCLELHVQALLGQPMPPQGAVAIGHGSHLLWRWDGPAGIVCATPDPGVYDAVAVSGLPAVGTYVLPGAIVARLESDRPLAAPDGRALTSATAELLDGLRDGLEVMASLD